MTCDHLLVCLVGRFRHFRLHNALKPWLIALSALLAVPLTAQAGFTGGTAWLSTQQNSDGSFGNTATSLATPIQSTAEVLLAYQVLGLQGQPAYAIARGFINNDAVFNTEFLARKITVNANAGSDVSALVNALLANQNGDGGFGDDTGQASSILSTAFALQALAAANYSSSQPVAAAIGFLMNRQGVSGGWADGGNAESVHLTALAMRSLWYSRHIYLDVPTALNRAQAFLLSKRDAAGLWGETFDSALSLIALAPYLPDLTPVTGSVASLRAGQFANGSWGNDAYTTALALRALSVADSAQPNPDYVTIQGRVIDAQTGSPLSGVNVALSGPVSPTFTTNGDGAFSFHSLPAGNYTVQVSLASYGTLSTVTSGQFGQTLDLGTLSLVKSQGATTGTIKGVITDSATAQPLAGVTVSATGAASVLTDVAGGYQLSNVAPGLVTVNANLSGYATASGSANLVAGGVVIFSPALSPGATLGATLSGTVMSGATGAALSGVTISVSGAVTASAITDAAGAYQITNLTAGEITLTAKLAGYDTVTAGAVVSSIGTVRFSPTLYPINTTPRNTNTSSVTGLVLDAGSNVPLAGATITAVFGATTQTLTTDAVGRFTATGLTAPQGTLHVAIADYVGVDLAVALDPLTTLDIGQVRLRRTQAPVLLPDLTITAVDHAAAATNPRTLVASGTVAATLSNIGTANAPAGIQVLVFYDANHNGVFDQGDNVLGQFGTTSALAVGGAATVSIPVQGTLPFRDAPISVWVDSAQTLIEINETNNVASSSNACEVRPDSRGFKPVLKWEWKGSKVLPDFDQVMTAPVVGQTNDDNGDGVIDGNDIPDVIFMSYTRTPVEGLYADGVLRVVSGKDGTELLTVTDPTYRLSAYGNLAIADIDGDGIIEIIGPRSQRLGGGIIAFEHTGAVKWVSATPSQVGWGAPAIADLDGDGSPEIVFGKTVLNANGTLRWQGTAYDGSGAVYGYELGPVSIIADLDMDGVPEVIAGASAYSSTGQTIWQNANVGEGLVAIGNLNADPYPEIVLVRSGRVFLLDHTGRVIWGPVYIPEGGAGGAPTIADLTGDGIPEIGVAGRTQYAVFRSDGTLLWTAPTHDVGSNVTASSVFDFDGDGRSEIVYGDERLLHVFNGADGRTVFEMANSSGTAYELPVIADIDSDGHADIVVASNQWRVFTGEDSGPGTTGIRVFQDQNNSWVNTRKIWNQHSYHITNINDDGTVPKVEKNSWQTYNNYRLNTLIDQSPTGVPDLTVSFLSLIDNGAAQPLSLIVRVGNAGAAPSPNGVQAKIYRGDPALGGTAIATVTMTSLAAGAYRDLRVDNVALPNNTDLFAVVDAENMVTECNEANNTDRIPAVATNLLGTITVATDASSYGPTAPVAITATVTNTGALATSYQLDLRIEDASGVLVAQLPAQGGVGPLASNVATAIAAAWNTGTTLAGNYQLHGRLLSSGGALIGESRSSFTINLGAANANAVTLRVLTDRPIYHSTDTVRIESLIANPTVNVLLDAVSLRITVLDPHNQTVFTHIGPIGQLPPNSLRNQSLSIPLNGAALASYKVVGDILDANQTVLAHAETSYAVRFDLAKSLSGKVAVALPAIDVGTDQSCTDTVTNLGAIAVAGLQVHHALVNIDTQQLISDSPAMIDLLPGAVDTRTIGLPTNNLVAGNYACALRAQIDGQLKTLAFTPFKLSAPPIRIDAEMKLGTKGRLLVLLDTPSACDDDGEHGTMSNVATSNCHDSDEDQNGRSTVPTLSAQRAFLENLLKTEGWSYTVTQTSDDFARAFHTGGYTVYALLSQHIKLSEQLQHEVRERVFAGDGLLVAGDDDERDGRLGDALGIEFRGHLQGAFSVQFQPGLLSSLPTTPLITGREVTRVTKTNSRTLAAFTGRQLQSAAAVLRNDYGAGRSAYVAFDTLLEATAAGNYDGVFAKLLSALLQDIHPPALHTTIGSVLPVVLTLHNTGIATTGRVLVNLDAGVSIVSAASGTIANPQHAELPFQLSVGETLTRTLWLRVENDAPLHPTITAEVQAGQSASITVKTATLTLDLELSSTFAEAQALASTLANGGNAAAKRALVHISQAATWLANRQLDKALKSLVEATDTLVGNTAPGIVALRRMMDESIRITARQLVDGEAP